MIVTKRSYWQELAAIPGDPASKRPLPLVLRPLLMFLNCDARKLEEIADKVSRLIGSQPGTPGVLGRKYKTIEWNEWIKSPELEDPLVLCMLAAGGKGLNLGPEDMTGLRRQLKLRKLKDLQRDLRDDVTLLVDATLADDESTERRVNNLIRHLNETVETIRWSIYEKKPKHWDKVGSEEGYVQKLSDEARAQFLRDRLAVEAREARSVKRHPDIFGKQADLPFTTRYAIAEKAEAKGKPGLRKIFYLILSDLARNKLQRPRRCTETECAQFFIHDDPREIFCSVECRDLFHRRNLSSRVARSRAKKKRSANRSRD